MATLLHDVIERLAALEDRVIALEGGGAASAPTTDDNTITLELDDVKDAVLKAAERGVPKTIIKGILVNYGEGGKLTTISEDHYPEVVQKLLGLKP